MEIVKVVSAEPVAGLFLLDWIAMMVIRYMLVVDFWALHDDPGLRDVFSAAKDNAQKIHFN